LLCFALLCFALLCFALAVPLLALLVVVHSPAATWVAIILVAPPILIMLVAGLAEHSHLLLWAHGLESIMCFYAATALIMYSDGVVTLDELFASGVTFTFCIGLFCLSTNLPTKSNGAN